MRTSQTSYGTKSTWTLYTCSCCLLLSRFLQLPFKKTWILLVGYPKSDQVRLQRLAVALFKAQALLQETSEKFFLNQSCCRWWFPTSPNKSGNYAQLVPTSRLGSALFPYTILLVSYRPLLTTNPPPLRTTNCKLTSPVRLRNKHVWKHYHLKTQVFFLGGGLASHKF